MSIYLFNAQRLCLNRALEVTLSGANEDFICRGVFFCRRWVFRLVHFTFWHLERLRWLGVESALSRARGCRGNGWASICAMRAGCTPFMRWRSSFLGLRGISSVVVCVFCRRSVCKAVHIFAPRMSGMARSRINSVSGQGLRDLTVD